MHMSNQRFCCVLLLTNWCIILLISSYFINTYFISTIQDNTTNIKLQIDSQTSNKMINFLAQYKNRSDKPLVLVLNGGNTGDVLIAYGTILLFNSIGLKYTFGTYADKYNHSILFYGGGGNFIAGYAACHW
eukprot:297016_1